METKTKVALGIAGAVGLGTAIVFWPKKAKAGTPGAPGPDTGPGIKPVTKDSGAELIQACVDGTKEGGTDGSKDGASASVEFEAPMPRLGYSAVMAVQAKYEQCYQDAYKSAFKISKKVLDMKKFKTDEVVPTSLEMSTAKGSGYSAGSEQGRLDGLSYHAYEINYARVPSGYRSQPSNPILAKEWAAGYRDGYGVAFKAAAGPDTGTPKPYGTDDEDDGFGDVLGEYVRVGSGRIVPRTRVGAMFMSKTTSSDLAARCRGWAWKRGRDDGLKRREYNNEIVYHSDIYKDIPSESMRRICAKAILEGYKDGYETGRATAGLIPSGQHPQLPGGKSASSQLVTVERPAPRPAVRMPVLRAIALPVTNIYDRARETYRHIATQGLVSGALSSRSYYK